MNVFTIYQTKAQSLERQTISSSGSSLFSNGTLIRQTIGQPYSTATNYNNKISFLPGFQQPIFRTRVIRNDLSLKLFPNPATEYVIIESSYPLKEAIVNVVDNSGKLVFSDRTELFEKYQLL